MTLSIANSDYQSLSMILKHSQNMLVSAEMGDWEKLIEDESRRRKMISVFFSKTPNDKDVARLRDTIEALLAIDDRLKKIVSGARDTVKQELTSITSGRHAVNAYKQNRR